MDEMEVDGIPPDGSRLEAEPVLVQCVAPYLELQALQRLRSCSRSLCALLSGGQAGPQDICAQKVPIDHAPGSACRKAFDRWGPRVSSLTLHRAIVADRSTLPTLLTLCSASLRRLSLHDLDASPASWNSESVGAAVLSCVRLEELRLHANDLSSYDSPGGPFAHVVAGLPQGRLPYLKKLTLFTRLDQAGCEALAAYMCSMDLSAPSTVYMPGLLSSPYVKAAGGGGEEGTSSACPGSGGGQSAFTLHTQAAGESTGEGGVHGAGGGGVMALLADLYRGNGSAAAAAGSSAAGAAWASTAEVASSSGAGAGAGAGPTTLTGPAPAAIQGIYGASRRLVKLKLSTSVLASPSGLDVLSSLSRAHGLQKVTIMRPEGVGEPLRKAHCVLIGRAMHACTSLHSVHLRRAGMWTDTLAALRPPAPCPNIRNLKLDSNSLGYLSGSAFNDAIDGLLSKFPCLEALHAGNNTMNTEQAVALARSIRQHKLVKLENLTLGSNDIGDAGLEAVLKALPDGMRQLYLHGCDLHDAGMESLRDALDRMEGLWGLGLNGNPITDSGVRTLARALRGRPCLRDVGITLSEMSDEGVVRLANALKTCPSLRFVYLYTQGYKAATKVTEEGKQQLKHLLPTYATPAFDHRLSRYLKQP